MVIYYKKDGVLTDTYDREMVIEDTIGNDVLNCFGEDEDDVAYARNERLGTDFEIILEHMSFASLIGEDTSEEEYFKKSLNELLNPNPVYDFVNTNKKDKHNKGE